MKLWMILLCVGLLYAQDSITIVPEFDTEEELFTWAESQDLLEGWEREPEYKHEFPSTMPNRRCDPDYLADKDLVKALEKEFAWYAEDIEFKKRTTQWFFIPVYYHNIRYSSGILTLGHFSNSQIVSQLAVVNQYISQYRIRLVLSQVHRYTTSGPLWNITTNGTTMRQFKYDHYIGVPNKSIALNVYSSQFSDRLGFSHYPWLNETNDHRRYDGIVIDYRTAPGGSMAAFNQGKTLVHEFGHWLGLLHVALSEETPGSCNVDFDGVSDTPIQSLLTTGCPSFKDTCPRTPGHDNIHNFMDYSDDVCLTHFTNGQLSKMFFWMEWRHQNP